MHNRIRSGCGLRPEHYQAGPELAQLGVVASARAFVLAAEHSSDPNGLLPGFYGMHYHMKASLAYALLLDPKDLVQIPVTIPEGWRLSQVVAWLGAKSGIPARAYAKVLKDPASLDLPAYANGNPEGYLFPATCDEAGLPSLIASCDGRWVGLSLTMPLKRAVLPLLDRTEPLAAEVGGANTVVFAGGERHGYNTDVPGLVVALAEAGVTSPASATILGAGATACAALGRTGLDAAVVQVESGAIVVSGFDLLLHQAALQVELMTGIQPAPLEAMRAAGQSELARRAQLPAR